MRFFVVHFIENRTYDWLLVARMLDGDALLDERLTAAINVRVKTKRRQVDCLSCAIHAQSVGRTSRSRKGCYS